MRSRKHRLDERGAAGEAVGGERGDVERVGVAVEQQLGQQLAGGGGVHQAVAGEAGGDDEAVGPGAGPSSAWWSGVISVSPAQPPVTRAGASSGSSVGAHSSAAGASSRWPLRVVVALQPARDAETLLVAPDVGADSKSAMKGRSSGSPGTGPKVKISRRRWGDRQRQTGGRGDRAGPGAGCQDRRAGRDRPRVGVDAGHTVAVPARSPRTATPSRSVTPRSRTRRPSACMKRVWSKMASVGHQLPAVTPSKRSKGQRSARSAGCSQSASTPSDAAERRCAGTPQPARRYAPGRYSPARYSRCPRPAAPRHRGRTAARAA